MVVPAKVNLLNILLADDGSLNARAAAELLSCLPHDRESMITALRVFTPIEAAEYSQVAESIQKTTNFLRGRHLRAHTEVMLGYPVEKIVEYASDHHPDLIVVGAKGAGATLGGYIGSTAMSIVHDGHVPVLIVREPKQHLRRIALIVDGSPHSETAAHYLAGFPIPTDATVDVITVIPPFHSSYVIDPFGASLPAVSQEEIDALKRDQHSAAEKLVNDTIEILAASGMTANGKILEGVVGDEIVAYAKENEIDLIVCGSRGRGSITSLLLGSVSRHIVHFAPCSVLVVRGIA